MPGYLARGKREGWRLPCDSRPVLSGGWGRGIVPPTRSLTSLLLLRGGAFATCAIPARMKVLDLQYVIIQRAGRTGICPASCTARAPRAVPAPGADLGRMAGVATTPATPNVRSDLTKRNAG